MDRATHSDIPIEWIWQAPMRAPASEGIRGLLARDAAQKLEEMFPGRPEMQALYFRTKIAPYLHGLRDDLRDTYRRPGLFNHLREQGRGPNYSF